MAVHALGRTEEDPIASDLGGVHGTCELQLQAGRPGGVVARHRAPRLHGQPCDASRRAKVRPHTRPGAGLYFWHIFPGSPADTFGLSAPGWLVQATRRRLRMAPSRAVSSAEPVQGGEALRMLFR